MASSPPVEWVRYFYDVIIVSWDLGVLSSSPVYHWINTRGGWQPAILQRSLKWVPVYWYRDTASAAQSLPNKMMATQQPSCHTQEEETTGNPGEDLKQAWGSLWVHHNPYRWVWHTDGGEKMAMRKSEIWPISSSWSLSGSNETERERDRYVNLSEKKRSVTLWRYFQTAFLKWHIVGKRFTIAVETKIICCIWAILLCSAV